VYVIPLIVNSVVGRVGANILEWASFTPRYLPWILPSASNIVGCTYPLNSASVVANNILLPQITIPGWP